LARNRQDLVRALSAVTSELLKEKGYICFVDVLMKLDDLSKSDYEHWRFQRVSPLERVLRVNLSRINFIMKTVRRNSLNGHLQPSMTVYKSWGKGKKTLLQFSKSGDSSIEAAYATHFVRPPYTYCLPLSRFRSYAVISRASDEHPGVVRPWPGGEKRRGGQASHHEVCEAMRPFLFPCAAAGVSLRAV